MIECKDCNCEEEKVCNECVNYHICKDTVDFKNPPDQYPDCWFCKWNENNKCINEN